MSKVYKCKVCSSYNGDLLVKTNNENFELNRCPICASLKSQNELVEVNEDPKWLEEESDEVYTETCFKCSSSYDGKLVFVYGKNSQEDILKYIEDTRCPRCGLLSQAPSIWKGNADFEQWKEQTDP